jgi:DNA-binding MarR family transcriptional regulator
MKPRSGIIKNEAVWDCTCFNLRKATRAITQLFDEAMQPAGLRATQFTILAALSFSGPVPITHLSNRLVMDRTTLTRNLKPLQSSGWVSLVPGEDRRVKTLSLTGKGEKTLKKALPYWKKAQSTVIKRMTPKRWRALLNELSHAVHVTGTN